MSSKISIFQLSGHLTVKMVMTSIDKFMMTTRVVSCRRVRIVVAIFTARHSISERKQITYPTKSIHPSYLDRSTVPQSSHGHKAEAAQLKTAFMA